MRGSSPLVPCGPGDPMQVVRLYLLSHLTGPIDILKMSATQFDIDLQK